MAKYNEKNYIYWQKEFDGHNNYMIGGLKGQSYEFYQIRKEILKHSEQSSLLDVGCASGGTYDHLIRFDNPCVTKYKGVDFASNFIKTNRKRFPETKWEVQDARSLKEKDKSWDIVLLYDTLDGMPNWEKALNEAIRVAKKRIIIVLWIKLCPMEEKVEYLKSKGLKVKNYWLKDLPINEHYFIIGDLK